MRLSLRTQPLAQRQCSCSQVAWLWGCPWQAGKAEPGGLAALRCSGASRAQHHFMGPGHAPTSPSPPCSTYLPVPEAASSTQDRRHPKGLRPSDHGHKSQPVPSEEGCPGGTAATPPASTSAPVGSRGWGTSPSPLTWPRSCTLSPSPQGVSGLQSTGSMWK